jgi:hypothetical protein
MARKKKTTAEGKGFAVKRELKVTKPLMKGGDVKVRKFQAMNVSVKNKSHPRFYHPRRQKMYNGF